MNGLTCVRRIRELEQQGALQKRVPVIAVTANVRAEQIEIAMGAGMDSVISKPFRIPELLTCIQNTLQAVARLLRSERSECSNIQSERCITEKP